MTKHSVLRATNLHQPRQFYTYAVSDVGDIQKVWGGWVTLCTSRIGPALMHYPNCKGFHLRFRVNVQVKGEEGRAELQTDVIIGSPAPKEICSFCKFEVELRPLSAKLRSAPHWTRAQMTRGEGAIQPCNAAVLHFSSAVQLRKGSKEHKILYY